MTRIIFFDPAKTELRHDSTAAIFAAAMSDKTFAFDHIIVFGYADASGNSAPNERLALARAQVVRDQLVADGVAPAKITIQATTRTGAMAGATQYALIESFEK